jgi:hypothetical protein
MDSQTWPSGPHHISAQARRNQSSWLSIGTEVYCASQLQKTIAKVQTDLALLNHFLYLLHQRIKLAIYCATRAYPTCNNTTRCLTTSWPLPWHSRTITSNQPIRSTTTGPFRNFNWASSKGGGVLPVPKWKSGPVVVRLKWPCCSAAAALYVSLREFRHWYQAYAETWPQQALYEQDWLSHATASCVDTAAYFPYFATEFETACIAGQLVHCRK